VTIHLAPDACEAEIDFHAEAELESLAEILLSGQASMALLAGHGDAIILLCRMPVEAALDAAEALPLVSAGLAHAEVRAVRRIAVPPPGTASFG
jgi:hypothetical protein